MQKIAAILFLSLRARSSECQGLFEDHANVGTMLRPGSVSFDQANRSCVITARGENMWSTADAFHFVWKKFSGDVSLTADITFPTKTGNPHKKASEFLSCLAARSRALLLFRPNESRFVRFHVSS